MHCIQLLGFSQFNQLVALSYTLKRKISKFFLQKPEKQTTSEVSG